MSIRHPGSARRLFLLSVPVVLAAMAASGGRSGDRCCPCAAFVRLCRTAFAPAPTSRTVASSSRTSAVPAGAAEVGVDAAPLTLALAAPTGDETGPAPPHVVFVLAEDEYHAADSLPPFAKEELEKPYGFECTYLTSDSKTDIPGLEKLDKADLAVFFIRRRTLPEDQMRHIREYLTSGRPLVALRTASHSFENWKEFDPQVLGGHYHGHHGTQPADNPTRVSIAPGGGDHPILRGFPAEGFTSVGTLYEVSPLAATARPLLLGQINGQPAEPVAWTNTYHGGRVFYTSLGHPDHFKLPAFRRLLVGAVFWALGREPAPGAKAPETKTPRQKTAARGV